ncbi:MAG: hypothetical protein IKV03_02850 [Alphaproteobacteria bacterium]|nr:hypothetical protein [Alphaproteobacteria bacterium]
MFNKSYDWAYVLLWTSIFLTLFVLGWSILYEPYWFSLTIVTVLLALFIIMGYLQYMKVLALKRKFVIVQETFSTLMLMYFAFYYFYGKREIPKDNLFNGIYKKIDDIDEISRYHLIMPIIITVLKTFSEIKKIKNIISHEVKNFASVDGINVENAKTVAIEFTNLFQKIKQLVDIVSDILLSNKDLNNIVSQNINDTIYKEQSTNTKVNRRTKTPVNDLKNKGNTIIKNGKNSKK